MIENNSNYIAWALTAVAVLGVVYFLPKLIFGSSSHSNEHSNEEREEVRKLERLPVGRLTLEQIKKYQGENKGRIFLSICGRIFDMTAGADFYGIGGPYSCFVGGDASYMLGAMSLNDTDRNKKEFESDDDHQATLSDWIGRFRQKYPIVGRLDGFEDLCPESWIESGVENDNKVSNNLNIMNNNKDNNDDNKVDEYSLSDLKGCGNNLISVCGYVFDINGAHFVYENIYGDFPNAIRNDISIAIALNDFNNENYNKSIQTINQNNDAKRRLLKMLHAFRDTYPIVGKISDVGFSFDEDGIEWDIVHQDEAGNE